MGGATDGDERGGARAGGGTTQKRCQDAGLSQMEGSPFRIPAFALEGASGRVSGPSTNRAAGEP